MDLWRIDSVQIITIKWGKKERKRAHTHRHEMLFGENKVLGRLFQSTAPPPPTNHTCKEDQLTLINTPISLINAKIDSTDTSYQTLSPLLIRNSLDCRTTG